MNFLACAAFVVAGSPAALSVEESDLLDALLPDSPPAERLEAFAAVQREADKRFLAPLVDLLAFAQTAEEWYRILDAAGAILDEPLREIERPWRTLTLRLAGTEALPRFEGYPRWKGELLAQRVDPRFRTFFASPETARVRFEEIVWGGVAVDGIPPLDYPKTVPALLARYLDDDESVFGIAINGKARAYPLRVLDWHEMANDELGGVSFALAYCTLCGAGVAYRTDGAEEVDRFSSSGLLMRSNKLMYDARTETLWNQLTGEAVVGPRAREAEQLATLPVVVTSWGEWRRRHPETDVLALETGHERRYEVGAATGEYFAAADTMFPAYAGSQAAELGERERLFVVRLGAKALGFRLAELAQRGVVNEQLGDVGVVALGPELRSYDWSSEWEQLAPKVSGPAELSADQLLEAWQTLAAPVDVELLLAVRHAARAEFFVRALESADGADAEAALRALRDEVATRALQGEARAYLRGARRFRRADPSSGSGERLVDERGVVWEAREDALVSAKGERAERAPGHLLFGFAWRSFFPASRLAL